MNEEFGKIGRTWWFAIIVFASALVLLLTKQIDIETFKEIALGTNGVGGVKSIAQLVLTYLAKTKGIS